MKSIHKAALLMAALGAVAAIGGTIPAVTPDPPTADRNRPKPTKDPSSKAEKLAKRQAKLARRAKRAGW